MATQTKGLPYEARIEAARSYVSKTRSGERRRYAEDYLGILLTAGCEPIVKEYGISLGTAATVRVALGEILGEYAR